MIPSVGRIVHVDVFYPGSRTYARCCAGIITRVDPEGSEVDVYVFPSSRSSNGDILCRIAEGKSVATEDEGRTFAPAAPDAAMPLRSRWHEPERV